MAQLKEYPRNVTPNSTIMTKFDQYQNSVKETSYWPTEYGLLYLANALGGEAGELQNLVKKVYRDSGGKLQEDRREAMIDELGDVLWYVAAIASELQINLSEVAYRNRLKTIQKMKDHNPIKAMSEEQIHNLTEMILQDYEKSQKESKRPMCLWDDIDPLDRNKGGIG